VAPTLTTNSINNTKTTTQTEELLADDLNMFHTQTAESIQRTEAFRQQFQAEKAQKAKEEAQAKLRDKIDKNNAPMSTRVAPKVSFHSILVGGLSVAAGYAMFNKWNIKPSHDFYFNHLVDLVYQFPDQLPPKFDPQQPLQNINEFAWGTLDSFTPVSISKNVPSKSQSNNQINTNITLTIIHRNHHIH
jgi:hypothetical protein